MLQIQRVLRNGTETTESLSLKGIRTKEHPLYAGLWHFCYDQIESKPTDPFVQETRGLILNSGDDWNIVATPFLRFANHGESWAASLDWSTARVQEKIDGSLMILWHYAGQWNVSTKGSPNAGGQVDVNPFTFRDLFWRIWKDKSYDLNLLDPNMTYMMELISPFNRVICEYKNPDLILLGSRNRNNLTEINASDLKHENLPTPVKEYPLSSLDDVIEAAKILKPESGEGFVVVDENFNRIKIKSPAYVLVHHAKEGFGQRRIIDLIRMGETSEVLSYFPEYQTQYDELNQKLNSLVAGLESDYERLKHIENQKDFAIEAVKTKYSAALFQVRSGRASSIKSAMMNATTEVIEKLLGVSKTNGIILYDSSDQKSHPLVEEK